MVVFLSGSVQISPSLCCILPAGDLARKADFLADNFLEPYTQSLTVSVSRDNAGVLELCGDWRDLITAERLLDSWMHRYNCHSSITNVDLACYLSKINGSAPGGATSMLEENCDEVDFAVDDDDINATMDHKLQDDLHSKAMSIAVDTVPHVNCTANVMDIASFKEEPCVKNNQLAKRFKCDYCDYSSNLPGNLKQHISRIHGAKRFSCPTCGEQFSAKRELVVHALIHTKPHECTVCEKRFATEVFLSRHHSKVHYGDKRETDHTTDVKLESIEATVDDDHYFDEFPFKCDKCDHTTNSQLNLLQHRQRRHLKREHECADCGKSFGLAKDLLEHSRWHRKQHECTVCGQMFAKGYLMMAHIAKKHPSCNIAPLRKARNPPAPQQPVYACQDCSYISYSARYLQNHVTRNHSARTHKCGVCDKAFGLKKDLKQHEALHARQAYVCSVCSKVLHSKIALKLHVNALHKGIRPERRSYLCTICGKLCRNITVYQEHQNRDHLNVKPFECSTCAAAFHGKATLRVHMLKHTAQSKLECEECGKEFVSRTGLYSHRVIHQQTRPFQCTTCEKRFTQKAALIRHERIHTGERPFKCGHCPSSFNDNSILRRHIIGIHKIPVTKCATAMSSDLFGEPDTLVITQPEAMAVDKYTLSHRSSHKKLDLLESALLALGSDGSDGEWAKYSAGKLGPQAGATVHNDRKLVPSDLNRLIEAAELAMPDVDTDCTDTTVKTEVMVESPPEVTVEVSADQEVVVESIDDQWSELVTQQASDTWVVLDQSAKEGGDQVMYQLDDGSVYIVVDNPQATEDSATEDNAVVSTDFNTI